MNKMVLSLDVHDDKKCKRRALKMVSSVPGLDSISMDMNEKKMTLIGNMDPIQVVNKLRKVYRTEIVSVGPAKEPEKPKENTQVVEFVKAWEAYDYSHYPRCYSYYYA